MTNMIKIGGAITPRLGRREIVDHRGREALSGAERTSRTEISVRYIEQNMC